MAKKVTITYAGSSIQINTRDDATIADVLSSSAVREDPTMTFIGDRYRVTSNGIEIAPATVAEDGATYSIEQRASGKGDR